MFKAAIEYTMGNNITTRSLHDGNLMIEKQVFDAQSKMNKNTNSMNQSFQATEVGMSGNYDWRA